jgi:hypothetical protein
MPITIDGYTIDLEVSSSTSFPAKVTRWPVEKGARISDHIVDEPITVTLEGLVSDTPIGNMTAIRAAEELPSTDAYLKILEIREVKEPVTIVTSLSEFDSMALETVTIPKDVSTGDALRFTATFVQVEIVENDRTTVKVSVPRAKNKS